jgi:hypothetical protein
VTIAREPLPDILRGFAIFAMLVAHAAVLVPRTPGAVTGITQQLNDVASPLFALVMGMTAALVADRRRDVTMGRLWAAVLLALGFALPYADSWVAIVLGQLGLVLLVGFPLVRLRAGWLVGLSAAFALLADPLNAMLRGALPATGLHTAPVLGELSSWAVLSTHYRLTNLLPWFLLGAGLYTVLVRSNGVRPAWMLVVIAPAAYVVRPILNRQLGVPAVSGSIPDTLHDAGLVFALVGGLVLWRRYAPRALHVVTTPFRAAGAVSLSLYVAHVLFIAWVAQPAIAGEPDRNHPLLWAIIVIGGMLAGWLWWRFVGKGPIERVMALASSRLVPRRQAVSA